MAERLVCAGCPPGTQSVAPRGTGCTAMVHSVCYTAYRWPGSRLAPARGPKHVNGFVTSGGSYILKRDAKRGAAWEYEYEYAAGWGWACKGEVVGGGSEGA